MWSFSWRIVCWALLQTQKPLQNQDNLTLICQFCLFRFNFVFNFSSWLVVFQKVLIISVWIQNHTWLRHQKVVEFPERRVDQPRVGSPIMRTQSPVQSRCSLEKLTIVMPPLVFNGLHLNNAVWCNVTPTSYLTTVDLKKSVYLSMYILSCKNLSNVHGVV